MDNRRKHKRIDYKSKVHCVSSLYGSERVEHEEPLEFELVNISAGGLGIITENKLQTGALLVLNIRLEDQVYENITAKVMWDIKSGDKYRYGLQITNISGKLYSHINELDNSIVTKI